MPVSAPTLRAAFQKFDLNGDGAIDATEVDAHFKKVGIDGGLVGNTAREKFFEKFGGAGTDRVTWTDFCKNGAALLPPGVTDARGGVDVSRVDEAFDQIAGRGKPATDQGTIEKFIKSKLPFAVRMTVGGTVAAAGALSAMMVLDADGDGRITRDDMKALVADINKEIASL